MLIFSIQKQKIRTTPYSVQTCHILSLVAEVLLFAMIYDLSVIVNQNICTVIRTERFMDAYF